jgi:hypothetical protein
MQERIDDEPIVSDTRDAGLQPNGRFEHVPLLISLAGVLAIAAYSWWVWRGSQPPVSVTPARAPIASASATVERKEAARPAVEFPVEPSPASAAALPSLDESDLELARSLEGLVGPERLSQLRTTGFVRRCVATVDNLARAHAAAHLWPVNPAAGRFDASEQGGQVVISADNELRYAPFVLLVESVDIERIVALYRSTYPLFQQAYEELGYPGRYFNDRLVQVIDHLMAAPEPTSPVRIEPVRVQGPIQLARPGVHYIFADPALESLSAGQKIMVRVGTVNERRLKAKLAKLRMALTARPPAR